MLRKLSRAVSDISMYNQINSKQMIQIFHRIIKYVSNDDRHFNNLLFQTTKILLQWRSADVLVLKLSLETFPSRFLSNLRQVWVFLTFSSFLISCSCPFFIFVFSDGKIITGTYGQVTIARGRCLTESSSDV